MSEADNILQIFSGATWVAEARGPVARECLPCRRRLSGLAPILAGPASVANLTWKVRHHDSDAKGDRKHSRRLADHGKVELLQRGEIGLSQKLRDDGSLRSAYLAPRSLHVDENGARPFAAAAKPEMRLVAQATDTDDTTRVAAGAKWAKRRSAASEASAE